MGKKLILELPTAKEPCYEELERAAESLGIPLNRLLFVQKRREDYLRAEWGGKYRRIK